ncbi:hypothetical protein ACIQ2D_07380 [Lysinibacillus sp. NPDC097287]|uniref:hypothetical protein n=1 Tax=Lysinibacillus sp. NPDC097287 TaxID=3364144 RepID=UPI003826C4B3
MLTKIRKVKFEKERKNPLYNVVMECPDGKELYVKFDYTYATGNFWPLEVNYNKKNYGAKLAWYTQEVEKMTVASFLEAIATKINKKYNFEFKVNSTQVK